MSATENLQSHQQEIMQEMQHVQKLVMQSTTGKKVQEASGAMGKSGKMRELIESIGETEREDEKLLLMKYLGDILARDPANGLAVFANYLNSLATDPKYASRKEYYLKVGKAAVMLGDTQEYKDYTTANKIFEADTDANSVAARDAMKAMQAKMKQWAGA